MTAEQENVTCDIVIAGGEVIDPGSGKKGRYDIAIRGGRIYKVERDLGDVQAASVIDASGCIVTPGLVDLHTHVFGGGTYWGIDPGSIAYRTGVTTWVDAGSAGAFNFAAFRELIVEKCVVKIKAFINISAVGLVAETGELTNLALCDVSACVATIESNRDIIVGIKCRLDRNTVGANGLKPLERALEVGERTKLPVMVHIGEGPPSIDDVLVMLRPGDIITHCATGRSMSIVCEGKVRRSARLAKRRGVVFDLGHGYGGFSFNVAESLIAEEQPPDTISSDLHSRSVLGPVFDLPTCLGKLVALGLSWEEVIAKATVGPARAIGIDGDAGTIEVGKPADIAVFEMMNGEFIVFDSYLATRLATELLATRATIVGGRLVERGKDLQLPAWIDLSPSQRSLLMRTGVEESLPLAALLQNRDDFVYHVE